ncbi:MBL fold metallo-hydrolase [Actinophytocola glycyrrhizae]|uniref:MBL fold metallo-hydrolase n=1 Tax=Actinophytocola glycyrrhizae TaxID=2044873 RepID=A0ABV9RTZ0_9PSEU
MEITELLPCLHQVGLEFGQAYLWRDGDELTLVDTGIPGSGDLIAAAVASLGLPRSAVRRIVITHGHEDHAGSAAEIRAWDGAPVHVHVADAPVVRGERGREEPVITEFERPYWDRVTELGITAMTIPPSTVDVELAGGEELPFGDGARVLSIPGHTAGSVAIHLPRHGVLFAGDTVACLPETGVIPGAFNVDAATMLQSYRMLADLDPDIVCVGHGSSVVGGAGAAMRAAIG